MMLRFGLIAVLAFTLCGCGDGESAGSPPVQTAPSGLTYASPPVYVVAKEIATLMPTVAGSVSSYAASPALPPGLTINSTTGAISGTPTATKPKVTYTVTATNSSGSTTAAIDIVVNDVTPTVAYAKSAFKFSKGAFVTPVMPSNSGGAVVNWSINPALPDGLKFSATDGSITGTPTATSTPVPYIVTALNSGGQVTVQLTIEVESGVLVDLGHAQSIATLDYDGTRLLSEDVRGHWVLWNSQTAASLASGETSACTENCSRFSDLAGSTTVVRMSDGLQIRSSVDGHVLANVPVTISWWALATDGSYVCVGNQSGLTAWTPSGSVLFTKSGNYSNAAAFAAAGELRIAKGAAGANVIERLVPTSGSSSSTAALQGDFQSWFLDGERFITRTGNTVWIYSRDGVQQDLQALATTSGLAGQGNWFWTRTETQLSIFAVGNSAVAAATYNLNGSAAVVPSRNTIAVLAFGSGQAKIIDLSGTNVADADHTFEALRPSAYSAIDGSDWIVGNDSGVVLDASGPPNTRVYFGYGKAVSIAGGSARIAVATASKRILYFDSVTKAQEGTIAFGSSKVAMSADGTVLAAANLNPDQYVIDGTLKLFSLPSASTVGTWPYDYNNQPNVRNFWLSGSGSVIATQLGAAPGNSNFSWNVMTAAGAPIWSATFAPDVAAELERPVRLSFDGSLLAVPDGPRGPTAGSNIIRNGSLAGAVPGWAVGWIDDNRLLTNRYVQQHTLFVLDSTPIVDTTGQAVASPALPGLLDFQLVTPASIYDRRNNKIYSLTTGSVLWTSSNPTSNEGAIAAGRVIFSSGAVVRAEPY